MFYIKVRNGLGNQMFVYAFGEYLRERFPSHDVAFDYSDLPYYIDSRKIYSVNDIFVKTFREATPYEIRKYCGHPFFIKRLNKYNGNFFNRVVRKLNKYTQLPAGKIIIEPNYWNIPESFDLFIDSLAIGEDDYIYFDGFWENTKYLKNRHSILSCFKFRNNDIQDYSIAKDIMNTDSVSVHIRRGDYIKESNQIKLPKNFYNICGEEYYIQALNVIKKNIRNPHFFIFSDDPDFARNMFKNNRNVTVVEGLRDYEDLYLMTLCKHHVIANSTFSFWGAFLSENNGVKIAPYYHYVHMEEKGNTYKKFFNIEGWIYLSNINMNTFLR